ncbi:hypothetical protein D3C76_1248060 [compost metagenome]
MLARQILKSRLSDSSHGYETLTSSVQHYFRVGSQNHVVASKHILVVELLNLTSGAHSDVDQMRFNHRTASLVDCIQQGQRTLQGAESPRAFNCACDQYRTR